MSYKKTITPWLLALWLVLSLAGCASEAGDDAPTPNQSKVYLAVEVNLGDFGNTATRADNRFDENPWGGEDGNGDHKGGLYEYTINQLSVLLYSSDKSDMTDDEAVIKQVFTFSGFKPISGGGYIWQSGAVEVSPEVMSQNYHILVVANAGDLASWKGMKLKDVRDLLVDKVCDRADAISNFSNFVMSSTKDARLNSDEGSGTESDPYIAKVSIERLAARIDIMPNAYPNYDKKKKEYTYYYNVTDGSNVLGGFVLQYVMPYNVLTSGEYLIKRVTDGKDVSKIDYNSPETADAAHNATNYVICPWTFDHSQATYNPGKKDATDWANEIFPDFYKARNLEATHTWSSGTKASDPYSVKYYIVDYVRENTTTDNSEEYSTGLVFKGVYYDKDQWEVTTSADDIAAGKFGQPKKGATGIPKAYTYVIRHSDPDGKGTTSDPMHYGIVRNNIYRVRIDGVTGKGPDGMKITVNVRKWATYTHEETTM